MTKPPVVADADTALAETARRRRRMDHDHPVLQVDRAVQHHAGHAAGDDQRVDRADLAARDLPRHRAEPAGPRQRQLPALDADGLPGGDRGARRASSAGSATCSAGSASTTSDSSSSPSRRSRCPFDPFHLGGGALWLIGWRVVQGVGGAMLMASSAAILTDAFPSNQRGMALGREHGRRGGRLVPRPAHRRRAVRDGTGRRSSGSACRSASSARSGAIGR